MDFPIFHMDWAGNRMLIAVIAIIHVMINHPMAVGMMPLITLMEYFGFKTGDKRWDTLAKKILFICFIVTTTAGALTGVGIWLTTSLINPYAIGSLIRIFFWAWFTEWIIFVLEVSLILAYYLLWDKMQGSIKSKLNHIRIGLALSISSWGTMAIIVAILGFMMDPGDWTKTPGLITGALNPLYLPQLAFRTPMAMVGAGLFAWFLMIFFVKKDREFRNKAIRFVSIWCICWLPLLFVGAMWYHDRIPQMMQGNIDVAIATQQWANQSNNLLWITWVSAVVVVVTVTIGLLKPNFMPRVALLIPFILIIAMLGQFERVREFIRKPYVIGDYMYANGIRVEDYPLLQSEGILKYATYAHVREITEDNKVLAGQDVFNIACTRCHTTQGVNSVVEKFDNLYGKDKTWDPAAMSAYIKGMHNARPFMPPFPGNDKELDALVAYVLQIKETGETLPGMQSAGIVIAPETVRRSPVRISAGDADASNVTP
ncbi:MAG TPA: cytochrome [Phycisphaerales bacterium]|nr:cytochrome [Phycisphaerales bacterium]